MSLSETDHELIIRHYGKTLPKTKKYKKIKAERLVAQKLCSCIKKVGNKGAIGICTYSVVKNRGLKYSGLTCKKRSKIKSLVKTRKIVYKRKYRRSKRRSKRRR